jgi:putative hydrolase of the HAD superfamily
MGEIERRMTDFVEKVTGLPRDEAYRLQKSYLAEHGLTLGADAEPRRRPANSTPSSTTCRWRPGARPDLLAALERLPGRRLIFTNADDVHAERVLERLGLATCSTTSSTSARPTTSPSPTARLRAMTPPTPSTRPPPPSSRTPSAT